MDGDLADLHATIRWFLEARPDHVVHCAGWTDVDGCAADPALARQRNGDATGRIARACAAHGVDLVVVSTNEVFDGTRTDGRGYAPTDQPHPAGPYGASKLAGELAAREAFGWPAEPGGAHPSPSRRETSDPDTKRPGPALGIVRTAWLLGPPGNDCPAKILAAAGRAPAAGEPLRVVGDELGSPTYTADLADAIVELIGSAGVTGIHPVVNWGVVSRAGWTRELLRQARLDVVITEITRADWPAGDRAGSLAAPEELPGIAAPGPVP